MSIPCSFDPLGTGGALPPGYERVQSVLKPYGAYWQTDIPVKTGMRLETEFEIVSFNINSDGVEGNYLDFLARNLGKRLYYIWVEDKAIIPSRIDSIVSSVRLSKNTRYVVKVAQYANSVSVDANGVHYEKGGLKPLEIKNADGSYETFFLGRHNGATVMTRGSYRIFDLAMYEEGTDKLLFHFVPFRKMVNGSYVYGLYDVVNRKELPVVEGTISA